jgi:N-acylglucosamine 2-epimerase
LLVTRERAVELASLYRRELLESVVPFWQDRSPDAQHGGFLTCFDRDGTLYDDAKYVWLQGRAVWMFSRLYRELEQRPEWLQAAKAGAEFIRDHCFDDSGRMYFAVTRDGRRLTKPWSIFSECFAIIGFAEYARASGEQEPLQKAQELYWRTLELSQTPDLDTLSYPEQTRPVAHAVPMILLNVTQELRAAGPDPRYEEIIDEMLGRILRLHCHPEERALFENVGPDGSPIDSPDGRVINPGHAMESAWFILHEARHRDDAELCGRAVEIIDWSLDWGWDPEHGGMLYFLDSEGLPSPFLEWDMKLWWVHVETLYALLLAHHMTGRDDLLDWFERMHEWTWSHFPDPEHGEWYGYLHRTGDPASSLKGSMWKGFYHLPRGLLLIGQLLAEMARKGDRYIFG